jgi:hypothetical protein
VPKQHAGADAKVVWEHNRQYTLMFHPESTICHYFPNNWSISFSNTGNAFTIIPQITSSETESYP